MLLNASTHFLIINAEPRTAFLARENAVIHYFSAKNLLNHHSCHSISSIFSFQRRYRFVRNGQILLGHLCNLSDWGLSCKWWLSEGRTMRATAATAQNVIRSRIGLIALDSILEGYGRCTVGHPAFCIYWCSCNPGH